MVRALVGAVGGKREAELVPVEVSEDVGDAGAVVVRVDARVAVVVVGPKVVPVLANVAEAVAGVATYLVLAMECNGKQKKAVTSLGKFCKIFPSRFWMGGTEVRSQRAIDS